MAVTMDQIKALREETSAGIMDAKRALEEANGDMEGAKAICARRARRRRTRKKIVRRARASFSSSSMRVASACLLELNCETDFVARTEQFVTLGQDIARHIAETGPQYVSPDDIPAETRASEASIHGGSDEAVNIKLALLAQPFVGDAKTTVGEMVREAIGRLGENIIPRRFTRYELDDDQPGLIAQYIHGGRIGALLELGADSAEHVTNETFSDLARTIGQQIVGAGPKYINADDMPADERDRERNVHDGNDAEVDKELVLMAQSSLRDSKVTMRQLVERAQGTTRWHDHRAPLRALRTRRIAHRRPHRRRAGRLTVVTVEAGSDSLPASFVSGRHDRADHLGKGGTGRKQWSADGTEVLQY